MKPHHAFLLVAASALAHSQLVALPLFRVASPDRPHRQQPLMDPVGPALPPSEDPSDPRPPPAQGGSVILSDVMGRDRSINIFAGFVRDIEPAARRLDDEGQNTTVLAPLNSAVEALPRKPWEDPRDYGALGSNAYDGDDGYERAQKNLRRFVEAHMIPMSPWKEGEKVKPLGDDREVWWERKGDGKVIQPGNIEVVSVGSAVANGEVWILRGVRNYA